MKKVLISSIVVILALVVLFKINPKGSNKPVIKIDVLEIQLFTSTYGDITDLGYMESDCRDTIYLFTRLFGPNIYAITNSEGTVNYLDKEDSLISFIGLDVDENVSSIEIDDVDILHTSKEDLAKQFEFVEFNDLVRFVYKDHYFVCLSYTDDKLDGFGVMYNKDGKRSVREVDLFYREYADQWIIKKGSIVNGSY